MRIPYYQNQAFIAGQQIFNPGTGGPQSHSGLLAMAVRAYPTVYNVGTYALASMPRQVIGPTLASQANNWSNPMVFNNLEIAGLMKSPIAGTV